MIYENNPLYTGWYSTENAEVFIGDVIYFHPSRIEKRYCWILNRKGLNGLLCFDLEKRRTALILPQSSVNIMHGTGAPRDLIYFYKIIKEKWKDFPESENFQLMVNSPIFTDQIKMLASIEAI